MSKQTRNLRLNTEVTTENKNRSTHKKSLSI